MCFRRFQRMDRMERIFGRSINNFNNSYYQPAVDVANYGVNASLLIFSGLAGFNGIKQAAYAYDASKMDWQQQKDNITLAVILFICKCWVPGSARHRQEPGHGWFCAGRKIKIQNTEGAVAPSALSDLQGQYAGDLINIANRWMHLNNPK